MFLKHIFAAKCEIKKINQSEIDYEIYQLATSSSSSENSEFTIFFIRYEIPRPILLYHYVN